MMSSRIVYNYKYWHSNLLKKSTYFTFSLCFIFVSVLWAALNSNIKQAPIS